MKLHTKYFGTIEIDEKNIIDFPEGIPGFEQIKKFIVIHSEDETLPFSWLQGVDMPELAFVIIDPRLITPNYVIDIDDSEIEVLEIKDTAKVNIYSIVVVPEELAKMTANLKAPVLINADNNKGKQVVMEKGDYPIKYYFMEQFQQKAGG
ncbi:flagellar assembly protein FliW [Petroclostridium sp. X23]|uniref:flagellar assembly protein FliW n=1 Tax=Petroclostridium sp. X23 TaxID=3045146 RepID=UPI0024AE28C2|nr:flagellar assembly protein FliW [Petroclostridium sp. X23]WHH61516.1 flagellar assembly protein FliW [Petroclostridium sp. X23]